MLMLESTIKPDRRAEMGVSYGIDLGKLDVCFGGFSPTLMGDATAASKNIDEVQQRIRERKLAREHAALVEASRESEEKQFSDEAGNLWTYVEVDGKEIRINSCQPNESSTELVIPSDIEDKPVVALQMDSLSYLKNILKIDVPDSIISVGACAFRHDEDLREVRLPEQLSEFKSDWFRNCNKLEKLTLSGNLDVLKSNIFDIPNLKVLHIGSGAQNVMPGAFEKSNLQEITISPDNPFMKTDGKAIYNLDGTVMAALAVPVKSYKIIDGCKALGNKAFSMTKCVEAVEYPDSLEIIGNFALSKTSIVEFVAPPNLTIIMEKAFFNCEALGKIRLNEGLKVIEKNALTSTAISELTLPSTVERLDYPIAARTSLTYSGSDASFKLAPDSQYISMDGSGGLYRKGDDGLHLIYMLDPETKDYSVLPDTVVVEAHAFESHPSIENVVIPSSVKTIEKAAFKNCHELKTVAICEGLTSIEAEAFLNTSLQSIFIPKSLESIGENALVTRGSHHGDQPPTLHEIEVSPDNAKFYMADGLLLERKNERTSKVVICADDRTRVVVPKEVDEISPYAFNGATQLLELYLSDRISTVGIRGLAVASHLDLIHVDLVRPIDGCTYFEFRFPSTTRGQQQQLLALSTSAFINVESLFDHYDSSIVNASSFDSFNEKGLDLYEQAVLVIDRLQNPTFLSESNKAMCERILKKGIEHICVEMAKHDDRESINQLVDLGFLNKDNILDVIDRVGAVQDASMTGYFLEINRGWSTIDELDFEL